MIDRSKLPFGGEAILVSRMRKLKPERVFVSLLPVSTRINVEPYALVRAIPGKAYDWRFLVDIDTVVLCNQEQQSVALFEQLAQLAKPLSAWFVDEECGYDVFRHPTEESLDKDVKDWVWKLDFHPWYKQMNSEWRVWMMESLGASHYV